MKSNGVNELKPLCWAYPLGLLSGLSLWYHEGLPVPRSAPSPRPPTGQVCWFPHGGILSLSPTPIQVSDFPSVSRADPVEFVSGFLKQNSKGDYLSQLESYKQKPLKATSICSSVVRISVETDCRNRCLQRLIYHNSKVMEWVTAKHFPPLYSRPSGHP